jgi:septal ring factor EnvC (AmiA/AmiB activator)
MSIRSSRPSFPLSYSAAVLGHSPGPPLAEHESMMFSIQASVQELLVATSNVVSQMEMLRHSISQIETNIRTTATTAQTNNKLIEKIEFNLKAQRDQFDSEFRIMREQMKSVQNFNQLTERYKQSGNTPPTDLRPSTQLSRVQAMQPPSPGMSAVPMYNQAYPRR